MLFLAKKVYTLYRPYFGGKKYRANTLALIGVLLGNLALAFSLSFLNVTISSLMGILNQPGVTYTTFFKALADFTVAMGIYGGLIGANSWLATWLGISLSKSVNEHLEQRWIESKAFYGTKFIDSPNADIDPAQVISHDSILLSDHAAMLFNKFLMSMGNFIVGMIGLFSLSSSLTITLFSTIITIPGYMGFATIIYALACNYLTSKAGSTLQKHQINERSSESELYNKIIHVKNHAEAIAFKKGSEYEHQQLGSTIQKNKIVQSAISNVRSLLLFMTTLNTQFSSIFALILSAPSIIAEKLTFTRLMEVTNDFQCVVSFFMFNSDNFDQLSECAVSLNQIEKFEGLLNDWDKFQLENKNKIEHVKSEKSAGAIQINNLTIKKSDGSPIIANFSATFPKGKTTLLQGPSGKGKTSILRAMSGLSPFASGQVIGVSQNTHFVPSQPYFPQGKTLLEAILYPRIEPAKEQEIAEIKELMSRLGFKQAIIDNLQTEQQDWYGPQMSDGERQRVEIISAIMKKPEVLLMDEATSRVDHDPKTQTKLKIEKLLKEKLPNTTIIYTDHNPSDGNFCDNKITIS